MLHDNSIVSDLKQEKPDFARPCCAFLVSLPCCPTHSCSISYIESLFIVAFLAAALQDSFIFKRSWPHANSLHHCEHEVSLSLK